MSDLTELREHLEFLSNTITVGDKVSRLMMNQDFKDIISEGFCSAEMRRCMGLAVCAKADPKTRELAEQMAKAGAILQNYLDGMIQQANIAKTEIEEVKDTIVALESQQEAE